MALTDNQMSGIATGVNAASSLAGGLMNQAFYKKNMKTQFNYWKKQFQAQNARQDQLTQQEYDRQDELLARQYAREDYLNQNSAMIQKNAMKQAGINTAALGGQPFGLSASSVPGSVAPGTANSPSGLSAPGGSFDLSNLGSDFVNMQQSRAQARLLSANARNQEIKNKFEESRQRKELTQLDLGNDNLQKLGKIYDQQEQQVMADTELSRQKKSEILATIANLEANTESISINNKTLHKLNLKTIEKATAEINKLKSEKKKIDKDVAYQTIVNRFADMGLFVGNDFLANLQFLASSGHGEKIVSSVISTLKSAFDQLIEDGSGTDTDAIKKGLSGLWDSFTSWIDEKTGWFTNDDDYVAVGNYYVDRSGDVFVRKGKHYYKTNKTLDEIK